MAAATGGKFGGEDALELGELETGKSEEEERGEEKLEELTRSTGVLLETLLQPYSAIDLKTRFG